VHVDEFQVVLNPAPVAPAADCRPRWLCSDVPSRLREHHHRARRLVSRHRGAGGHSSGCILPSGRVAAYEYPRYSFSNLSDDIRRIFCEHCELLGIRWTQSNPRNISVSHRKSVALMDEFIGPKW
jgi:hypothetical protein